EERSAASAIEILEDIIWTYGKPTEIITDNGEEFRSKDFQAFVKRYNVEYNHTSPRHPQTNGKVERLNHELIQPPTYFSGRREQPSRLGSILTSSFVCIPCTHQPTPRQHTILLAIWC